MLTMMISDELEQQWNSMESTVLPHNEEDD
jgi:hypothetical protein